MKKLRSKTKNRSKVKKLRKELEIQLTNSFNDLVKPLGTANKSQKIIEKFAKQLAKKVSFKTDDYSIAPFIKEDKLAEDKVAEIIVVKEIVRAKKSTKSPVE